MGKFRKFLLIVTGVAVFLIILLIGLMMMVTQKKPLIIETMQTSTDALLQSKADLKYLIAELSAPDRHKNISLTHQQMEQLAAVLSQSITPVMARYNYSGYGVIAAATITLPPPLEGRYINVSIEFIDNSDLKSGETSIGSLSISNKLFWKLISYSVSLLFDSNISSEMNEALSNAHFDKQKIYTQVNLNLSSDQFKKSLKSYLKNYRKTLGHDTNYARSIYYYKYLENLSGYIQGLNEISLAELLQPLFKEVRRNSAVTDPREENKAALIALAIFAGDQKMKNFLSRLIGYYPKRNRRGPKLLLAGREDLVLHFIYSVTIQLLTSEGLSDSIGELKEISDMGKGGSGFSFTDLAADRAGTRFAELATEQTVTAYKLQSVLSRMTEENTFFPDISLLTDNLSKRAFEQEYHSTHSQAYQAVVKEIDRRIDSTELYH